MKCITQSVGITQCCVNLNHVFHYCVCFTSKIDFYKTNTLHSTVHTFRLHIPSPLAFGLLTKPDSICLVP